MSLRTRITLTHCAGEHYGMPPNHTANLELVARYFQKYPEDKDKVTECFFMHNIC